MQEITIAQEKGEIDFLGTVRKTRASLGLLAFMRDFVPYSCWNLYGKFFRLAVAAL
jgi:hypothetical protein